MEVYFAITGLDHYYSSTILKPGMIVKLEKDYNNDYDEEAIAVTLPYLGKIGYVANSVGTVPKGCYSAGRLYDKFGSYGYGAIRFVGKDYAIAEFLEDDFIKITLKFKMREKKRRKNKNKT
jgi:hypothetical protein